MPKKTPCYPTPFPLLRGVERTSQAANKIIIIMMIIIIIIIIIIVIIIITITIILITSIVKRIIRIELKNYFLFFHRKTELLPDTKVYPRHCYSRLPSS